MEEVRGGVYIEVFLLDNLLANLLILRLAAALLSARPPVWRQLAAALLGSAAAALAAYLLPVLRSALFRLPLLIMMSLAFEVKGVRGRLAAASATALATLIVGGACFAVTLMLGGRAEGSLAVSPLPIRTALIAFAAASFLPSAARRMRMRRVKAECAVRLTVLHKGVLRSFRGIADTGNTLVSPIGGLPVIVLRCGALERFARVPVPVVTAAGRTQLPAFRPERACVCGREVDCLIALTRERLSAEALVPAALCEETVKEELS